MGCCPHRGQSRDETPQGAAPVFPHCLRSPSGGFWRRVPASPAGRLSWQKFYWTPDEDALTAVPSEHEK